MTRHAPDHDRLSGRPGNATRRGFSLVESTIAVVLVGGVYLVALNLVGASKVTQSKFADRQTGMQLAEELLAEVLAQPYADPDTGNATFGRESGESGGDRADWDDVDDYHGWTAQPPEDPAGNARAGLGRFTRGVTVERVQLATPMTAVASETGLKRITVAVTVGGRTVATVTGVRSERWPDAEDLVEPIR